MLVDAALREPTQLKPDDILANAEALVPEIRRRSDEISELRQLPSDLVEALREAGVFRMAVPSARGGPEMHPRAQMDVVELLSAADPSVGWCAKIAADSGFFASWLPDQTVEELYPSLDCCIAGLVAPSGRAERVPGGYRLTGRWGFGSGCTHADVIIAAAFVFEDGKPVEAAGGGRPGGYPEWRVVMAPAGDWRIEDTWRTTGLLGSGSHHYSAEELFIPEAHTFSFVDGRRRPEPLYAFAGMAFISLAGIPLGLGRRAIEEAQKVVHTKVSSIEGVPLKGLGRVRLGIARGEMLMSAARAYTHQALDRLWSEILDRGRPTREARVQMALSRVNAFRTAREVTQMMCDLTGTTSIYATSPLDRLMRDAITMNQHVMAGEGMLESLGSVILGEAPPLPIF
jgi:alkylation response protein AidB-like acyl-CoA dehydrogenase